MWIFKPILKSVIWGGDKIADFKGIETDRHDIGESWEISGVDGNESVVAEGKDAGMTITELVKRDGASLLGSRNFMKYGDSFPLLIKFIDAKDDLSVQVHPDDALANARGAKFGKTEMWYVVDAEQGARLANGFKEEVNPEDYERLVESGEIAEVLNFNDIKKGDAFFIPAGRVHAIGKGSFIAEIQQTSDITYRIFDYKRKDKDGNERQLHTAEAFDAINFKDTDGNAVAYEMHPDLPVNLVTSPFFTTNVWNIDHEVIRDYSEWDTFVILICVGGSAEIFDGDVTLMVSKGMSVLIPASCRSVTIMPYGHFEALETYIK